MKKVSFKELSDKRCTDCGTLLKANLVMKNKTANKCYCCTRVAKGRGVRIRLRKGSTAIINYVNKQKQQRVINKWK